MIIRRAPIATFVIVAFVISWALWSPLLLGRQSWFLYYAGVIGPAAAAFLCAASPFELSRGLVRWRVALVWYAAAILLPFAIRAIAVAIVLRGDVARIAFRPSEAIVRIVLLMLLLVPFEEIGWRGYALPLLQQRFTPLASSLILGAIWAAWHLPLAWASVGFQRSGAPWSYMLGFFVTILPVSCLATWLFNGTGGSLLLVTLFHIAVNLADFVLVLPSRAGEAVLYMSSAIGAIVVGVAFRRYSTFHGAVPRGC